MIVAIVNDYVVTDVITIADEDYQSVAAAAQACIQVDSYNPLPAVGWTFDGSNLIPVTYVFPHITKLAMLQRFTIPERIAIKTYIAANPGSVPAVLLDNVNVSTYIDLNRPDTQAGINYLVSFGLLTSDRATAILTTHPTAIELYQG